MALAIIDLFVAMLLRGYWGISGWGAGRRRAAAAAVALLAAAVGGGGRVVRWASDDSAQGQRRDLSGLCGHR